MAWRATLASASRVTATRSSARSSSTAASIMEIRLSSSSRQQLLSDLPSTVIISEGAYPRELRASEDSRRKRSTTPTSSSRSRKERTIERIWATDSSIAPSAPSRAAKISSGSSCSPAARRLRAEVIRIPVANSCWMARSCRSRPMRARSSSRLAISSACWALASSKAIEACEATSWAISRSCSVNSPRPGTRSSKITPIP